MKCNENAFNNQLIQKQNLVHQGISIEFEVFLLFHPINFSYNDIPLFKNVMHCYLLIENGSTWQTI